MKTLMVYGTNRATGEYKCIFGTLFPSRRCIATAKQTADREGYDICKVELSVEWNKPFKDVTEQFMKGEITETA